MVVVFDGVVRLSVFENVVCGGDDDDVVVVVAVASDLFGWVTDELCPFSLIACESEDDVIEVVVVVVDSTGISGFLPKVWLVSDTEDILIIMIFNIQYVIVKYIAELVDECIYVYFLKY